MGKLWVARNRDGHLYGHFGKKPRKFIGGCWYAGPNHRSFKIEDTQFPDVQWADKEPTEVILIKKADYEKI